MLRTLPLLALASILLVGLTQPEIALSEVRLRTGTLTANDGLDDAGIASLASTEQLFVVASRRPIDRSFKHDLTATGATIVGYLPERALAIWAARAAVSRMSELDQVHFIARLAPELKLTAELLELPSDVAPILEVAVVTAVDSGTVAERLEALGLEVLGQGNGSQVNRIVARAPANRRDLLLATASVHGVFAVTPRPRYRLHNDTSIGVGQSGVSLGPTPMFDAGLHGEGQIVGYIDTGCDIDACYFYDPAGMPPTNTAGGTAVDPTRRKVIAYDFLWSADDPANDADYDNHNHGTHVGGSIAGDNFANPIAHDTADGMAPAAKLVVQDGGFDTFDDCADMPGLGCPVVSLTPFFDQAYAQGVRIHSNSWGDQENAVPNNNYTQGCWDIDDFVHRNPDLLVLFSAGNDGSGDDTVGSPGVSKNVLSVGATRRGTGADTIAGFSSRGWAADGRNKPSITCPGVSIQSARNDGDIGTFNCGTRSMSGTSMSAPTCAGLAALARQYYTDGFYPSKRARPMHQLMPSAALLRATLINSARPMANETAPISRAQGFGRVTLADTLVLPGGPRDLLIIDEPATFPTGSTASFTLDVEVVSSAVPLKVTLAWTDPPSTLIAATNLVNDLDLVVRGPSDTYLGNVLSGGFSVPGGTRDSLNVEEQVLIDAPPPGTYRIEVNAAAIPEGAQGFGLVLTGDFPAAPGVIVGTGRVLSDSLDPGCNDMDDIPDNGETVRLIVEAVNPGDAPATNVEMTLTSASPYVTMLTPSPVAIGTVNPGATGTAEFDFALAGVPCRDSIEFDVVVTSTENLWPEPGTFSLLVETDRSFGTKTIDFESGLADSQGELWTTADRFDITANRANGGTQSLWAGVPPAPNHCDGSGSRDGANQCASLRSPLVTPSASSVLRLATWYETEDTDGSQWFDRANVHVIASLQHTVLTPSSGRPYDGGAGDSANLCHLSNEAGWAGPGGNSWATSTFDLSPWAGQEIAIEVNYNSDGGEICEGLYVDDIIITDVDLRLCESGCACAVGSLSPLSDLMAVAPVAAGQAVTFYWNDPGAGGSSYHLNTVEQKTSLTNTDPQSPRQTIGMGTMRCDTTSLTCVDSTALDPARPALLYYQVLAACGPLGADEGPI